MITQAQLKELFHYDPLSGVFTRKVWVSGGSMVGDIAGSHCNGYLVMRIDKRNYRIHRLAWLYVYGSLPEHAIDHINGIKDDNRIANLRDVTHSRNCKNRKRMATNKSGVNGVFWKKQYSKWCAKIQINGNHIYLGYFAELDDAKKARQAADVKYGYHENHGRVDK